MRLAIRQGLATAPGWTRVLDAAEEWGTPPWEIAGKPGKLVWWLRWNAYLDERIGSQKDAAKKAERERDRARRRR